MRLLMEDLLEYFSDRSSTAPDIAGHAMIMTLFLFHAV